MFATRERTCPREQTRSRLWRRAPTQRGGGFVLPARDCAAHPRTIRTFPHQPRAPRGAVGSFCTIAAALHIPAHSRTSEPATRAAVGSFCPPASSRKRASTGVNCRKPCNLARRGRFVLHISACAAHSRTSPHIPARRPWPPLGSSRRLRRNRPDDGLLRSSPAPLGSPNSRPGPTLLGHFGARDFAERRVRSFGCQRAT